MVGAIRLGTRTIVVIIIFLVLLIFFVALIYFAFPKVAEILFNITKR